MEESSEEASKQILRRNFPKNLRKERLKESPDVITESTGRVPGQILSWNNSQIEFLKEYVEKSPEGIF